MFYKNQNNNDFPGSFRNNLSVKKKASGLLKEKFIVRPSGRVVMDVISDAPEFGFIPYYVIMKAGLPAEIRHSFPDVNGAYPFILVDDYADCAGMPLRIVPPGFFG